MRSRKLILDEFGRFRDELDEHNDRRERLIKSSRDVTNLSKKAIFLLHRLVLSSLSEKKDDYSDVVRQGRSKLKEIQSLFAQIREDIDEARYWRYSRAISPGLQEYIEALSFVHYLENGNLLTFEKAKQSLNDEQGKPYFLLTLDDYILGVSDLTGELMRFAVTALSTRGGRNKAKEISDFVRNCYADFEGFTPYVDYLSKKQAVTAESILKIEEAAYDIALRASEYPDSDAAWDIILGSTQFAGTSHRLREKNIEADVPGE